MDEKSIIQNLIQKLEKEQTLDQNQIDAIKFAAYDMLSDNNQPLTLRQFLTHVAPPETLVVFREDGWQTGCTYVDHEDLFLGSLNPKKLDRTVKSYQWENVPWTEKRVFVVNLN